jgi:hypothetical protein
LAQDGNMPPNGRRIGGVERQLEVVLQVVERRVKVTHPVMQDAAVADFNGCVWIE